MASRYSPIVPDAYAQGYQPGLPNVGKGSLRELNFWHHYLSQRGAEFTTPRPLVSYLAALITTTPARILDIGSGAASQIGSCWPGVVVTAADRFAAEYACIWAALGMVPTVPVEAQDMTALTYPSESFDIVHCGNALDHCHDPFRAIREMVRVCKHGGVVYLRHLLDQGRLARYTGLHQWNIAADMTISRPTDNTFHVDECVPGFIVRHARDLPHENRRVIAVLRKP